MRRGGAWVAAQSALLGIIALCGGLFPGGSTPPEVRFCGWILWCLAAVLGFAGAAALGRQLTPFPKPVPDATLVRTGAYRLVRHPLYVAVFCAALGWALLRNSLPAMLASAALAVFFDAKARREEVWLRAHFADYAAYERTVKRFIPWVY